MHVERTDDSWTDGPGVLVLPSGVTVRGRSLRSAVARGESPTFAVHLTGRLTLAEGWETRWVRWPDFWIPRDPADAVDALREAYTRAASERVEIACSGGIGRTGTGLAALCVLDGLSPDDAVAHVRRHYHRRAVETPWQRRFLRRL